MIAAKIAALVLYATCLAQGGDCAYSETRVTSYVPELGGINCDHDCSVGAWSIPLESEVSVACGPSFPFETRVYIFTPWGEVLERLCHDRGGAIHDFTNVDVYMTLEEHEERPLYGHDWPVVWELPEVADRGELAATKALRRAVQGKGVEE